VQYIQCPFFRYLEFAEHEIDEDDSIHNGTHLVAVAGIISNQTWIVVTDNDIDNLCLLSIGSWFSGTKK
jgi:hypothetical protein